MKSFFRLLVPFLIMVISSATPSAAALHASESAVQLSQNPLPLDNSRAMIFLPTMFKVFLPSCNGIPGHILDLFGASLVAYYPLWELEGNTVVDLSPNNYTGVYAGNPALNAVPALCGGSPRFDGIDDSANIFSPGLSSSFNGDEGTLILQLKIENEQWTDGKTAYYLSLHSNSNNNIALYKSGNHKLDFAYTAGGIRFSSTIENVATSHWVTYAITWSKSQDRFSGYVAGENIYYPDQSGLESWIGPLTSAQMAGLMGSDDKFARASISSLVLLDRAASPDEIRSYSAIFGATKVLTVLGDSISRVYMSTPWSMQAVFEYGGGNQITLKSHAKSGNTIMEYMDEQTAAAASDDADIIIIELGTVDDNAGDMAALQAKVEKNVTTLKETNPRAMIYYMNVLPFWTDKYGSKEVDKSNIRAAIAQACASTGITCWDTYTSPWIAPADTYDGVHPNPVGQAKIASQVLFRLQAVDNLYTNTP